MSNKKLLNETNAIEIINEHLGRNDRSILILPFVGLGGEFEDEMTWFEICYDMQQVMEHSEFGETTWAKSIDGDVVVCWGGHKINVSDIQQIAVGERSDEDEDTELLVWFHRQSDGSGWLRTMS